MNYKIKGVGIDTTSLLYKPDQDFKQEFVFLELRSNNYFLLGDYIKESSLIVGAHFIKGLSHTLANILSELGRPKIEVLLISEEAEPDVDELRNILDLGLTDNVGVLHPSSIEHLKETAENIKKVIIPKYISLDISPVHFQKEIIDWAEEQGMSILGFNPFGGYINSANVIQSFTIPFLLNFAAVYSEVVFLSGRDLVRGFDNSEYLKNIIGNEEEVPSMYSLDVSVDLLKKPMEKMVWTVLKAGKNIIPYDNPDSLFLPQDMEMNIKQIPSYLPEIEENDKVIDNILEYNLALIPEAEIKDPRDYITLLLPGLMKDLKQKLYNNWTLDLAKISDTVFIIKTVWEGTEKRIIRRDKKVLVTCDYLLTVNEGNILSLVRLKNSYEEN